MDDVDRAQERIEQTVSDGIRKAGNAQSLKPTGYCYYCNEAVQLGRLFCCSECRDDWDYEQARKEANK